MIYLPDTNAFSRYLRGASPELTRKMADAVRTGELRLSVMVYSELLFGAQKAKVQLGETKFSRRVEALRQQLELEPLAEDFPAHYAEIRTALELAGQQIGDRDTIIAAHALALDAVVVTANVAEFSRVKGLKVENWQGAT